MFALRTNTQMGLVKFVAAAAAPVCESPLAIVIVVVSGNRTVTLNVCVDTPDPAAVTCCPLMTPPKVQKACATPEASVVAVCCAAWLPLLVRLRLPPFDP